MFNWWEIYLWLRLDGIREGLGIIIILYIAWTILLIVDLFMPRIDGIDNPKDTPVIYSCYKKVSIIGLSCLLLYILIPSTKDFAIIYLLPKLTNSKTIQTLLKNNDNVEKILQQYIEEKYSKKINNDK